MSVGVLVLTARPCARDHAEMGGPVELGWVGLAGSAVAWYY